MTNTQLTARDASDSTGCSPAQAGADSLKNISCGATLTGPSHLSLSTNCPPNSGTGTWCSQMFTLHLSVHGGNNCATCLWPPAFTAFVLANGQETGARVYTGEWCASGNNSCTAEDETSAPQYVVLASNYVSTFPSLSTVLIKVSEGISGFPVWQGYLQITLTKGPVKKTSPNVLNAKIKLTTATGGAVTGSSVTVGSKLVATVTLSVDASATGPVTGIRASPPVTVSPSNVLTAGSGPSPPFPGGGLSIGPGSSATYTMNYVVASLGKALLSVKATGTGPGGSAQQATDSTTVRLGQPLSITVKWLQNGQNLTTTVGAKVYSDTLQLADGDQAEVPADVTAKVIVKNVSTVAQENVSINGVPPFSFATKAQAVRALPVSVSSGPTPGAKIGTLAPGASKYVTYGVHVTNNGTFNFTPQVLSSSAGSTGTNVSEATSLLTVWPTKLLWLDLHPLETGLVKAGTPVLIGGTVTNRSLTQTLDLDPLLATLTGNAGGGDLVDQKDPPQPDGVDLPFAGEIAPGDTIDVIGEVGTSLIPGSRAEVSYAPTGTVTEADGTSRDLDPKDVGSTKGSTPIDIHLDVSDPPVPPSTLETIGDNFTNATFYYTAKYSYLAFKGVAEMLENPSATLTKTATGIKSAIVATGYTVAETSEMLGSIYLLGAVGDSLTPEERQAWADQIVADFKASHLKIAADKAQAIYASVDHAAYDAFVPFQNALQTGDYNTIATLAGQGFGAGLTTTGDLLVSDIIFQKFLVGLGQLPSAIRSIPAATGRVGSAVTDAVTSVRSAVKSQFANDISLAAKLREAKITQSLGKGLEGIVAGQNLLADGASALINIYGLTRSQIKALQAFCETNQLIIAVRSRSRKAAELIRDGLAVGKNEILKIKNVSELDVQYLGYSSADLNTMVWAEPVPIEYVLDKLRAEGASALQRDIVLQRFYLREAEWVNPKITHVIDDARSSGTIPWNLDGSGNGANTLIEQTRSFGLQNQPSPVPVSKYPAMKDRTYQQITVGNKPLVNGKAVPGTRLVPVTQDVDMMAILTPNGNILDAAQRAKVYEYLSDIIGIEHGETPSWILYGEMIFQAKAKILADAIPGGEALAVFGPDLSVTAGFFNPALTTFNNVLKTGRIFFQGGYNSTYYLWKAQLNTSLAKFANVL